MVESVVAKTNQLLEAALQDVMRSLATLGDRQTGGASGQQLPVEDAGEGAVEQPRLEVVRRESGIRHLAFCYARIVASL
ncbi:MAG: hypothetical protein ACI8UO_006434 [Verrucomicrobiales bacterium]|jgi:hypothetical protein